MSGQIAELPTGDPPQPSLLPQHVSQGGDGRATPLPARPYDALEVRRFLDLIWLPGEVREIRIPRHNQWGQTAAGYFDSAEALAEAAATWDGKANIYVTLNPVNPALLARANNRIVAKAETTTSDVDVLERRWLFLDIDATRPSGISSSDQELGAAYEVLVTITAALGNERWPQPTITCLSGNGYYALYPVALPNTPESLKLVQGVLRELARRFDTPQATIDITVANAARIACLIGTMKVKGDSTEERPHRRSQLLSSPESPLVVDKDQLAALAADPPLARNPRGFSREAVEPLESMLARRGIEYREQPVDAAGFTWYHVRRCPFHDDGRDFECGVGQKLPDGPYAGKCFHPEGESKGWQDWKAALGLESRRESHDRATVTPSSDQGPSPSFPQTDAGNAELFAHRNADRVRYDHRRGVALMWDGHHFREDGDGELTRLAIAAARYRYQEATQIVDTSARKKEADFAIQSENRTKIDAMLKLAECQTPISTDGESWNREPMQLGVANGVLDLPTGTLHPGRPSDLITYFTDVRFDRAAACPRWQRFLDEIFLSDEELVDWIWRVAGYLLTALTTAQCFFLCYGVGANGKSVFLNVLHALLGRYAYNAPFATFESQARNQIPNDLAAMVGRRLVTASETNEGSRLNEARVKMLTGRDPVTARFLNREFFTFVPVAKYFLAVNHKPLVKDYSYGFWRRVRLIPFLAQFRENADPLLEDTLLGELPGILVWAVEGCLEWQRRGLEPPRAVKDATASYRDESDPLAEFLSERCVLDKGASIQGSVAHQAYRSWAEEQGLRPQERVGKNRFGELLETRFGKTHTSAGNIYPGLRLREL